MAGLEYISDLLSRCAIYENGYRQRYENGDHEGYSNLLMQPSEDYKSALKELYIRILRFQARSVCQFSRNLASGTTRAMFKKDDWDALLEEIKLQERNCQTFFDAVKNQEALDAREEGHTQRISSLLNKLDELQLGIGEVRDLIEEFHFSDEEKKCFEILRTSDYVSRKNLNPPRLPETCKWFLDHPKYKGWTAIPPDSRLLWVSADPGCGKSVLAKALVDDQYERGSVCYYFFKDDDVFSRSPSHALCALLHQICDARPALIRHVLPMYRRNGTKLVDLFEELWSIFSDVVNDKEVGKIICILDAIDECSDSWQKELLQRLATMATASTSIKILITSRPYSSIESALFYKTGLDKNTINLAGEAKAEKSLIEEEIGLVIKSRIQGFQELRESNEIFDDAHQILQNRCDEIENRTYLWVSAIFDELEREAGAPKRILMDTIKTLPETVDKAYENILKKSSNTPVSENDLRTILQTMLVAVRPFTLMEMNVALSTQRASQNSTSLDLDREESFSKWIRNLCGFFINIIDDKLYFVHQTAREFLIGEEGYRPVVRWKGSFQQADSHILLALICIDYLTFFDGDSTDANFEDYATWYWMVLCQNIDVTQQLADKVKSFLFQNGTATSSFNRWRLAAIDIGRNINNHVGLRIGDNIWDHQIKIRTACSSPPTPFFLACAFGWSSIIDFITATSKSMLIQQNHDQLTGLHIAALFGHFDIVERLLIAGSDVNIQDYEKNTALHVAAENGRFKIVEHLLAAGVDFNIQNGYGDTVLHLAAKNDHFDIVKHLLVAGIDVNIQNYQKNTALHMAVRENNFDIVKRLLTAGVDVNIQNRYIYTALHVAAENGHFNILAHLSIWGVDVNIQNSLGETALHVAAKYNYFDIVKRLLESSADVNIQNDDGDTPLHFAVIFGRLESVKLLLKAGVDVEIKDFWGRSALQLAKSRNRFEIVKTLLAAGAHDSKPPRSKSVESLFVHQGSNSSGTEEADSP